MGLNIQATRKLSLKEFAIGWDQAYLIINTVSSSKARETLEKIDELQESKDSDQLNVILGAFCAENIVKGKIVNTAEDGTTSLYEFSKEELPDVVDALNTAWQLEVIAVATGSDRLKA